MSVPDPWSSSRTPFQWSHLDWGEALGAPTSTVGQGSRCSEVEEAFAARGWLARDPPSSTPPTPISIDYGLYVCVCLHYFQVWGKDGFANPNPGFLQFTSPTWGWQADLFWVRPCSNFSLDANPAWVPHLPVLSTQPRVPGQRVSVGTHVHASLPTALITLFPTLLFGIFHRRRIYYNSRGENSKSLAKFRSRAHLNFYSGFSIYLIYSCLWLQCQIAGVLRPAQACSGRRCVRPHDSLAGAAQTAALIYLVLQDAVCSVDSVI